MVPGTTNIGASFPTKEHCFKELGHVQELVPLVTHGIRRGKVFVSFKVADEYGNWKTHNVPVEMAGVEGVVVDTPRGSR